MFNSFTSQPYIITMLLVWKTGEVRQLEGKVRELTKSSGWSMKYIGLRKVVLVDFQYLDWFC